MIYFEFRKLLELLITRKDCVKVALSRLLGHLMNTGFIQASINLKNFELSSKPPCTKRLADNPTEKSMVQRHYTSIFAWFNICEAQCSLSYKSWNSLLEGWNNNESLFNRICALGNILLTEIRYRGTEMGLLWVLLSDFRTRNQKCGNLECFAYKKYITSGNKSVPCFRRSSVAMKHSSLTILLAKSVNEVGVKDIMEVGSSDMWGTSLTS